MKSIVQAIATHAERTPEKVSIIESTGECLSYKEFWNCILTTAQALRQLNVKKNDAVCIECVQNAKFLEMIFACQLIGAIYIPLESGFKAERLKDIRSEIYNCLAVVTTIREDDSNNMYTYDMVDDSRECLKNNFEFPSENDVSEILFTTGTTGKSKGIVLTNKNNVALAENIMYGTEMKDDSLELIPLPLSHSHGLRTCYAHFLNGSAVMLADGVTNVKALLNAIENYGVTALDLSPSAAKILIKLSKGKLNNYQNQIDYVELGTAFLDEETKMQLCNLLPYSRLYNFYGSTESGRSCILNFNDGVVRPGCIGRPAKNAEFIIVDDNKNEINSFKNNLGLLAIAGTMNMREYYNEEELTKETMHNGYVYTHDLGYIDNEGYVYVLGRADDVINCRGIKIAPEEIESVALKFSSEIIDSACIAIEDKVSGQLPKLFIQIALHIEDEENLLCRLKDFLYENLEDSRVPKSIEIIDKIPRTENGKVLRRILRERK